MSTLVKLVLDNSDLSNEDKTKAIAALLKSYNYKGDLEDQNEIESFIEDKVLDFIEDRIESQFKLEIEQSLPEIPKLKLRKK